ncbi:dynein regulatory complex protein 9-like [Toxorhynchites rutilus septentrionalis]|uniref:dynein regulatory complex protein 9-like n=1 Tax=Toxorhynchites rutilus septentrionalis TaxID=329112 RepID=UPI00247AB4EC|nr:dynein regulatory complex protein 9-like [Toxorhynchites rutilus septentrionalis]
MSLDMLDETERTVVSRLINETLVKMKIIAWNSTRRTPIGDMLQKTISALENFHPTADERITRDSKPKHSRKGDRQRTTSELKKKVTAVQRSWHDEQHKHDEETQLETAKRRFVIKWEAARQEQLRQIFELRNEELRKEMCLQESEMKSALEVAGKVDEYYNYRSDLIDSEMADWMSRMESERAQFNPRLQQLRAEKANWGEMKAEVKRWDQEIEQMEEWEANYNRELKHRQMCEKYVVQLQAWWRGVMVRKGLGRFGKGKKKGKTPKKGKGKGKAKKARK